MSEGESAPETRGVTSTLLATLNLGPEIEAMAGYQLRMRMFTFDPGGVFGPLHDHKGGLRAGRGLARGSEHHPLAGEPRNDSSGGDLVRYCRC